MKMHFELKTEVLYAEKHWRLQNKLVGLNQLSAFLFNFQENIRYFLSLEKMLPLNSLMK